MADDRVCCVCNQPGADKKFGGNWYHKGCLRRVRKQARRMF